MDKGNLGETKRSSTGRFCALFCTIVATGLLSFGISGCNMDPIVTVPGDGDGGSGQPVTAVLRIVSFQNSFQISLLEDPVSVLYEVQPEENDDETPVEVTAYFQPVTVASSDAVPSGDRIVIATGLPSGTNKAFVFDPGNTGTGFYRVGVLATINGEEMFAESNGVVWVQGPPAPYFVRPSEAVTEVVAGEDVIISFDSGDPDGIISWRLFYLSETDSRTVTPDQLGTLLRIGNGKTGTVSFSTADLSAGDYEIGVSATDTGASIASTVNNGQLNRIVTVPDPVTGTTGPIIRVTDESTAMPPTLEFTSVTGRIDIFGDAIVPIQYEAKVNEPGATGVVDIFYDTDRNFNNRIFPIEDATGISPDITSVELDTSTIEEEGTYFIGGTILDGVNDRVVTYADGSINIVRSGTLTVVKPDVTQSLKPVGAEDPEIVNIVWTSNVPADAGTVTVVARTIGLTTNLEYPVLEPSPASVKSAEFTAADVDNTSGLYEIEVTIEFDDSRGLPSISALAPAPIRVSSLPTVLWLGDLDNAVPTFDGAIFQGVQSEDNAGSAFSSVGDINGDGAGEFVIVSRYGKPFFVNPTGIGPGEAYMVFGQNARISGSFNLNSIGTDRLPGVTFTGIRTPQSSNATDGLSSVSSIPDVDGDNRDELVFGFPETNSRGHNVDPRQDGVVNPKSLATLEREEQFNRGGVVIVSSLNSALSSPGSVEPIINLDLVGQDFDVNCVDPEPGIGGTYAFDFRDVECEDGSCISPASGGAPDGTQYVDHGFVAALARDFFSGYVYSIGFFEGFDRCGIAAQFGGCQPLTYCSGAASCEPFSPGLYADAPDPDGVPGPFGFGVVDPDSGLPLQTKLSGFYPAFIPAGQDGVARNEAIEPLGARIIGIGLGDKFGTSLTMSNAGTSGPGDLIVSAPGRTARGILLGPAGGPEAGGEIDGLESSPGSPKTNPDSGVAYMFELRTLWTDVAAGGGFTLIPPRPHQYIVGAASHCGPPFTNDAGTFAPIDNVDATRIAGFQGDKVTNVVGIDDFNDDGRNDFAIGAPNANGGQGRVYVAFRRDPGIEDDFVLEKLTYDESNPERLSGALFVSETQDALGFSLTSGVDFNNDGQRDLVIGSPQANNGVGEIIIVFGDSTLVTPRDGLAIQTLLTEINDDARPRAVRITGNQLDENGQFGFNLTAGGDVNNDGFIDLLVSAPNATPRFDPEPRDEIDELTEPGVDTNLDGENDFAGDLSQAGIVYVLSGRNRFDQISADPETGEFTISIDKLGSPRLNGYMIAGRRGGDHLGGGDAGSEDFDGNPNKEGRGRSFGLASAGDVDGDGRDDILVGSILADPRRDQSSGLATKNGGEAYLVYSSVDP